jgi:hypothetical protein
MAFPIIAAASLGISLIDSALGSKANRSIAGIKIEGINDQLRSIGEEKKLLQKVFEEKRGFVTDRFGNNIESLGKKVGLSYSSLGIEAGNLRGKSGFSYSGTVEQILGNQRTNIRNQFQDSLAGSRDVLQDSILNITSEFQGSLAELKAEEARLNQEKALLAKEKKRKFLGIF